MVDNKLRQEATDALLRLSEYSDTYQRGVNLKISERYRAAYSLIESGDVTPKINLFDRIKAIFIEDSTSRARELKERETNEKLKAVCCCAKCRCSTCVDPDKTCDCSYCLGNSYVSSCDREQKRNLQVEDKSVSYNNRDVKEILYDSQTKKISVRVENDAGQSLIKEVK